MFKRPRLGPVQPLVNVSLAASVIFISGCFGEQTQVEQELTITPTPKVAEQMEPTAKLQAVWGTRALSAPITDIALSGGDSPLLAATLEGGQMQLFNLDGERLSDVAEVGIEAIADGHRVALADVVLTLFPGIGRDGTINVYLYNSALGAPVALDLLPNAAAKGLCAGPTETDGTLLTLGYWEAGRPRTLIVGNIYEAGEAFGWDPIEEHTFDSDIGACLLIAGRPPIIESASSTAGLASLRSSDREVLLRRTPEGQLENVMEASVDAILTIRNGISIKVPDPITAFGALSEVKFGGYPNGVVIVGGLVNGDPKIVFVEPIGLFEDAAE